MKFRAPLSTLVVCAVVPSLLRSQSQLPGPQTPQPPGPRATPGPTTGRDYELDGAVSGIGRDDYFETHAQGGFRLAVPRLGLVIRGQNVIILTDLESTRTAGDRPAGGSGLPTRDVAPPAPRRRLSPEAVRARLESTLLAVGRAEQLPAGGVGDEVLDLFRYLYCEGGIVVVQGGVEVMRCDRLWISPIDDRIVVENAELRYITPTSTGQQTLVVRGPRLVKQGPRWVGRDLLLTTCTAGEPHAGLAVEEAEIVERNGEFEVVSRGQTLQVGSVNVLPLPDARIFTGSQSEFPIRRITAGYSGLLGAQAGILFGLPWNGTGGQMHNWLTGRPAQEFRGEWELGFGWIEQRGLPLEGALNYRAPGVYEGRTEAYWLDDTGMNLREIQSDLAGNPIDNQSRSVIRSENRIFFGADTHLDLVAFQSTDEAAYSEFFIGPYRTQEVPETSGYLHHAVDNHLLTVGTRFNLNDFSYRDDRALATRFIEELPVVTYQWLAQPIAMTPWETPIVLDLESQIGQRRSNYDDKAAVRVSDRSTRIDQLLEFSTPFHLGGISVRPYASGRGTFYDETLDGTDETRIAFEGGVQLGTRLSRTWRWLDDEGRQAVRHVIAPRVTYRNRFHVDDSPTGLFQYDDVDPTRLYQLGYDATDALRQRELVRFEVRNLFQKMVDTDVGRAPRDFVYLDLAQDIFPDKSRDNDGDTFGLFFYDLLLRPNLPWLPLDDLALAVYGDHDWRDGMQTFDTELQFGRVLGLDWTVEYREDRTLTGALGVGASARLLERWRLFAGSQRDLDRNEWLAYSFGLRRDDHDWSIELTAAYNPFSDETTFRIEFLPRFGGMNQPRRDRFGGAYSGGQYAFDY